MPCDRAEFVDDITVDDGTVFAPGTSFVKTWRLKNSGSCTWNSNYKLVFDSGAVMEGASAVSFTGNVSPGQTVDPFGHLEGPGDPGSYQGFWKLQNASGARFGIGANASVAFLGQDHRGREDHAFGDGYLELLCRDLGQRVGQPGQHPDHLRREQPLPLYLQRSDYHFDGRDGDLSLGTQRRGGGTDPKPGV